MIKTVTPEVTVFGRHARKLEIARALGLTTRPNRRAGTEAARFDVVVDATGRPEGMRRALELVRPAERS